MHRKLSMILMPELQCLSDTVFCDFYTRSGLLWSRVAWWRVSDIVWHIGRFTCFCTEEKTFAWTKP